jgi:hypothetical protein
LEAKEVVIAGLQDDIQKLLETKENRLVIAKQVQEIEENVAKSHASTMDDIQNPTDDETHAHDTNMLVDNDVIENVVATVTAGVLEDIHSPIRKRPSVLLPPPSPTVQSLNTEGTQDSLSFPLLSVANDVHVPFEPPSEVPDPPCQNEIIQLRGDNKLLRKHLSELSEQYYQWKVACILTMDKNRQMAIEMDKINKEYKQHNMMRDFGLTSWAHTDDMFPWNEVPTMKVNNLDIIDWAKCGWNYENATSSHHLQRKPSRKLWPNLARFVFDGTVCPICHNGFGPEGGWPWDPANAFTTQCA